MEDLTMFERLLTLPLFQGLTLKELSDVLAHVRLDFVNYQAGDEIVCQGDKCNRLIYIINGKLKTRYRDVNNRFVLTETLARSGAIEPYNMFGMYQKFSRDYIFATDGVTLSIDKHVVIRHLMINDIVKINMMNLLCNKFQQTELLLCNQKDTTVRDKIIKFFQSYSSQPRGAKEFQIKMMDLAEIINETRLNVSDELNSLQDKGLLSLLRGYILIPAIEDFKFE